MPLHMKEVAEYIREICDVVETPLFVVSGQELCVFGNKAFFSLLGMPVSASASFPVKEFWPQFQPEVFDLTETVTDFRLGDGESYRVRLASTGLEDGLILCRVLAGSQVGEGLTTFTHSGSKLWACWLRALLTISIMFWRGCSGM